MATQQQVQIAAKLYECRDTARMLGREAYAQSVSRWMWAIKKIADEFEDDILAVGMKVAADPKYDGNSMMWMLAATVELIEPDALTPKGEQ